MKKHTILTLFALLAAFSLLFSACGGNKAPQEEGADHIVMKRTDDAPLAADAEFEVEVYLNNIENVASFNLDLRFDPQALELVSYRDASVDEMEFITSEGEDILKIAGYTMYTHTFGEELVCTAVFRVLNADGETQLSLTPRSISVGTDAAGTDVTELRDQFDVITLPLSFGE